MKNIFFVLLLFVSTFVYSQGFNASIVLGLNAAQIDGDMLSEYKKLGLTGGAKVAFDLTKKWEPAVEFLYSQRGARNSFVRTGGNDVHIDLKYIEIPFILSYKKNFIEEANYHKLRIDGGFSFGRVLTKRSVPHKGIPLTNHLRKEAADLDAAVKNIKDNDYSIIIGVGFQFSEKTSLGIRYTRSLIKMYENDENLTIGLLGYFLTARIEYKL